MCSRAGEARSTAPPEVSDRVAGSDANVGRDGPGAPAPRESRPDAEPAGGAGGDRALLIVDDNPVVRAWIRAQLSRRLGSLGKNIKCADSIPSALLTLQSAELPHFVLLDISMPGLAGVEALRAIVSSPNVARVVTVSGMDAAGWEARMLEAGASAYVQKTTDGERFAREIRAALTG